jgi:hypothetical protein
VASVVRLGIGVTVAITNCRRRAGEQRVPSEPAQQHEDHTRLNAGLRQPDLNMTAGSIVHLSWPRTRHRHQHPHGVAGGTATPDRVIPGGIQRGDYAQDRDPHSARPWAQV